MVPIAFLVVSACVMMRSAPRGGCSRLAIGGGITIMLLVTFGIMSLTHRSDSDGNGNGPPPSLRRDTVTLSKASVDEVTKQVVKALTTHLDARESQGVQEVVLTQRGIQELID